MKQVLSQLRAKRKGFTLVELLVVIAIIAVLMALLLPAINGVRAAADRARCQNNVKQVGLGVLNFESTNKFLPSPGEGLDPTGASKYYDKQSFFVQILPYIEQGNVYNQIDQNKCYNETAGNIVAAKAQIPTFICPNAFSVQKDPGGYGQTSYMPISYTDINPATGLRDAVKVPGALRVYGAQGGLYDKPGTWSPIASLPSFVGAQGTISAVSDGTSNTVIYTEDGPYRNHESVFPFQTSSAVDPITGVKATNDGTPSGGRAINRWAEPETGNGVSGPPEADPNDKTGVYNAAASYLGPWINQNYNGSNNVQGKGTCVWSQNNCGPNDEPFSGHPGGAFFLFLDGHVSFMANNTPGNVMRYLIEPNDRQIFDLSAYAR